MVDRQGFITLILSFTEKKSKCGNLEKTFLFILHVSVISPN